MQDRPALGVGGYGRQRADRSLRVVNDIMSAPPLAVDVPLAAGTGTDMVPAAVATRSGGGARAGPAALVELLRRRLQVHENENVSSWYKSQKNSVCRKYRRSSRLRSVSRMRWSR